MLTGEEDDNEYLDLALLGQLAWNHSVSEAIKSFDNEIYQFMVLKLHNAPPVIKKVFDELCLRKAKEFARYNQFIFKVEIRNDKMGYKTLYVESAPADKIILGYNHNSSGL